ncbi:YdcF family protein [Paenibacillus sp. UMB4589-SE434]|uniref:YdcF family protein n=1 Tax=Paenibacillus sp. UMB4589-SE434 TaxID=3046314 RepID=UPI00254F8785|nr:YdcF family protein [Paenibacillus sp. UMB4589-SE434]MDK8179745.1 YdcF family protein [Paenibacillus sp. UMB4589-SE434]
MPKMLDHAATPMRSARKNKSRKTVLIRKLVLLVGFLLLLGLLWTGYVLWKITSSSDANSLATSDVGIVLGASLWGDEPSPGLKERLNLVVKLYNEGRFKQIIVTGGKDTPTATYTEAEGSKRYLIAHGIPESVIWLENSSTSTLENLKFAQPIVREHQWSSVTIVTHDFHGNRAYEIADKLGYEQLHVETVASKVLSTFYHFGRETLAYTKWKWDELWL